MPVTRQLPGIVFRAEPPLSAELPRMDIAAFVGFARQGPLHLPVPLESYADFQDIFDGPYRLAWDDETAVWQTACLAPAVKAFFGQGGRRCWVVRVAGSQAMTNQFPLAGLLQPGATSYQGVTTRARSPGSWSDGLQTRAGIQIDPLSFSNTVVRPESSFTMSLLTRRSRPVRTGDMLQLDFTDGIHRAYAVVESILPNPDNRSIQVTTNPLRTFWFRQVSTTSSQKLTGQLHTVAPAAAASAAGCLNVMGMTLTSTLAAENGDWLRLDTGDGRRVWLLAGLGHTGALSINSVCFEEADPAAAQLSISSAWVEGADPAAVLSVAKVQRLELTLQVRQEPNQYRTLANLACGAPHPRFIGNLPDDAALFELGLGQTGRPSSNPAAALWNEVRHPRFQVSLSLGNETPVIPLGLDADPVWRDAVETHEEPLVRDGLVPASSDSYALTGAAWANFIPDLFLDPSLRYTGQTALLPAANDRLYLQGRPLTGLHALLPLNEISMIAVPDAAQRGWMLTQLETEEEAPEDENESPPDPCARVSPFSPKEKDLAAADAETPPPDIVELPEIAVKTQWRLMSPLAYEADGLLAVQLAAAKVAAARADMVAVLGLPKHYRMPQALQYQQRLAANLRSAGDTTDSYAALYHPWLVTRETNGDLLHTHPAGGVCGVIAARSISRGAWVAPANEVIHNTLALLPPQAMTDDLACYQVGINPIRAEARGFVIWGEYTQSQNQALENINVRRLLILLRRLALVAGERYVFAPHSPAFRRRVRQQFEQYLARLFARGAFAGRDPSEAYRVVIDETVNTPASIEQGRLIVELHVAPSRPVTFITVRLVQLESGLLSVEEFTRYGS